MKKISQFIKMLFRKDGSFPESQTKASAKTVEKQDTFLDNALPEFTEESFEWKELKGFQVFVHWMEPQICGGKHYLSIELLTEDPVTYRNAKKLLSQLQVPLVDVKVPKTGVLVSAKIPTVVNVCCTNECRALS